MGDTKTCPSCGQEIKEAATLCRFCAYEYAPAPQPEVTPHPGPMPSPPVVPPPIVLPAGAPPNVVCDCALVPSGGDSMQFREPRMHVEQGMVTFTGKRLSPRGALKQRHSLLLLLVGPAGFLGLIFIGRAAELDNQTGGVLLAVGALFFLVMTIVWAVVFGRAWKTDSYLHTVTFPTTQVANAKLGYNWGTFWAVSIFFTVIAGALYLGFTGKNTLTIHAPIVPEAGVRRYKFTGNKTDIGRLTSTIAVWRASQMNAQPA